MQFQYHLKDSQIKRTFQRVFNGYSRDNKYILMRLDKSYLLSFDEEDSRWVRDPFFRLKDGTLSDHHAVIPFMTEENAISMLQNIDALKQAKEVQILNPEESFKAEKDDQIYAFIPEIDQYLNISITEDGFDMYFIYYNNLEEKSKRFLYLYNMPTNFHDILLNMEVCLDMKLRKWETYIAYIEECLAVMQDDKYPELERLDLKDFYIVFRDDDTYLYTHDDERVSWIEDEDRREEISNQIIDIKKEASKVAYELKSKECDSLFRLSIASISK
jgi:hypothetical protein